MHCIDFESAVLPSDPTAVRRYASRWGTQGFVDPSRQFRQELVPQDDYYAAAMTLYSCVIPITNLFSLSPEAETAFLDRFVALGLPTQVRAAIGALRSGSLREAESIIQSWHV